MSVRNDCCDHREMAAKASSIALEGGSASLALLQRLTLQQNPAVYQTAKKADCCGAATAPRGGLR